MATIRKSLLGVPERSLKECMRVWETVAYRAQLAKDRVAIDFTYRIAHQVGRHGWEPSPLQMAFIRRLVDVYCPTGMALDLDLIPGANIGWKLEIIEKDAETVEDAT